MLTPTNVNLQRNIFRWKFFFKSLCLFLSGKGSQQWHCLEAARCFASFTKGCGVIFFSTRSIVGFRQNMKNDVIKKNSLSLSAGLFYCIIPQSKWLNISDLINSFLYPYPRNRSWSHYQLLRLKNFSREMKENLSYENENETKTKRF